MPSRTPNFFATRSDLEPVYEMASNYFANVLMSPATSVPPFLPSRQSDIPPPSFFPEVTSDFLPCRRRSGTSSHAKQRNAPRDITSALRLVSRAGPSRSKM